MTKPKPTIDDLRRLIGYLIITFLATFIYFPFLWIVNLGHLHSDLYQRWLICSIVIVVFNLGFYFWHYPQALFKNLIILVLVNLLAMVFEYLWILS
ncbi:MAG: hypothetical protein ACYDEJ_07440 [Desulfitobacteriaceae bacterium]